MHIRTLWGKRPESYPGEYAPELMVAWDEYCLDENWDGWMEAKAAAIESWGTDLTASAELVIEVPDDAIDGLFRPPVVKAVVRQ